MSEAEIIDYWNFALNGVIVPRWSEAREGITDWQVLYGMLHGMSLVMTNADEREEARFLRDVVLELYLCKRKSVMRK